MADKRLHELLIRAELEDCKLLEKQASAFLDFWGVAAQLAPVEQVDADPPSASAA